MMADLWRKNSYSKQKHDQQVEAAVMEEINDTTRWTDA
jgi:hypothetical protein